MTDRQKLYNGILKVAWGYFFVYFNINISNISILPTFIGYLFFLSAIKLLQQEEQELALLRPMGTILAVWNGIQWAMSWIGLDLDGTWQFVDIIISLVNLYFHFQLITNIASVATKYQPEGNSQDAKLLRYRTVQTIILTAMTTITNLQQWLSEFWVVISVALAFVYVIVGVCLMKALFNLRKLIGADGAPA